MICFAILYLASRLYLASKLYKRQKQQQERLFARQSNLERRQLFLEENILAFDHQLDTLFSKEEAKMNSSELRQSIDGEQQNIHPGWLAIDFGTSNSTVTLFDPIEVEIAKLLPQEQQVHLLERLAAWLSLGANDALPNVNPAEWNKFINEVSKNLQLDSTKQLPEVFRGESQQRCLEAIRQIELCLGRNEQFRRIASKKIYQIYHETFRTPTLASKNVIPIILDITKRSTEISSELEILNLEQPLGVKMGEEAKRGRNKAISEIRGGNFDIQVDNIENIISRFHHSPKRSFGDKRVWNVSINGQQKEVTVGQLLQAAWNHLIKLTKNYLNYPDRRFSKGDFQMAIVTYPAIASPFVRKRVKNLVEDLGIRNVQTTYDEAVAVVMFFLWREFGGYLNIGIESFKTRCHREEDKSKWSQNVLVLDIGGGTTDLALIKLTLEDITPSFKDDKDRGLGGRYYEITPKLLGSSGHLQLGGELITLRIFRLLKVAIVDRLLSECVTDLSNSENTQALDGESLLNGVVRGLKEDFRDEGGTYKKGSLLGCIDKHYPERVGSGDYEDALNTAEKVLPTRWRKKKSAACLQVFYTLWDHAEKAKLDLGQSPSENNTSPLEFILHSDEINELLRQVEQNNIKVPDDFSVILKRDQYERAAFSVVTEAIGIAQGLMTSRLSKDSDNQQSSETVDNQQSSGTVDNQQSVKKVDWLILSGKTCNLHMVQREIRETFSKSIHFVWNPERITFAPDFTKIATSAGACYAEKMRQLKFSPEEAKSLLRKGANQLRINVKNLFYYLPCDFIRKTQSSDQFLEIFKAGEELYQISPEHNEGRALSGWTGIQLSNILYRQDYLDGPSHLWGKFDGEKLLKELREQETDLTENMFLATFQIEFEVTSKLDMRVLICRKQPHYLINDENENDNVIDLPEKIIARQAINRLEGNEKTSGLFSPEKLNFTDIAVNVMEADHADREEAHTKILRGYNKDTEFKKFHYASNREKPGSQTVYGLISEPLPGFPESGRHTFYIFDPEKESEKESEKWVRIGELKKPDMIPEFPCKYRVSLDAQGKLRLHIGEVPYFESPKQDCLLNEGCVFRTELALQANDEFNERDPFCGLH